MASNRIEWSTKQTTSTTREIATCKRCKQTRSRLLTTTSERTYRSDMFAEVNRRVIAQTTDDGSRVHQVDCCGQWLNWQPVKGHYVAERKCDARCVNSKGHVCECSCGGKNHGAGYGLTMNTVAAEGGR